ncbi:LOW QUALITY PROTEIN: uncharacterized protein ACRADG_004633 [Cochliomyia hominivorax]
MNHSPICKCSPGYTGDAFTRCLPIPALPPPPREPYRDPCVPSPCGQYAQCRLKNDNQPTCSCLPTYVGSPPNCRPECIVNSDCSSHQACINERCKDPCPGSCGLNALCSVVNHIPSCTCPEGYAGDPFSRCVPKTPTLPQPPSIADDPCQPSPCGPNSKCQNGICSCLTDYHGDPYRGCRPECILNSECAHNKACINQKCRDPCPGTCASNAICEVHNHIPMCHCSDDMEGNAFLMCKPKQKRNNSEFASSNIEILRPFFISLEEKQQEQPNPCIPSPCGPNSYCHEANGVASCTCLPDMMGSPPSCRPECITNSECPPNKACVNRKCQDPCPGSCGYQALCHVVNHNPLCSCTSGHTGSPFVACQPIIIPPQRDIVPQNPCLPSPCGPYSQCDNVQGVASCKCLPNYVGNAPYCRPECISNSECPSNKACINGKCIDPCPGVCGNNALCRAVNHIAMCTCHPGYIGDPFTNCHVEQRPLTPDYVQPQTYSHPTRRPEVPQSQTPAYIQPQSHPQPTIKPIIVEEPQTRPPIIQTPDYEQPQTYPHPTRRPEVYQYQTPDYVEPQIYPQPTNRPEVPQIPDNVQPQSHPQPSIKPVIQRPESPTSIPEPPQFIPSILPQHTPIPEHITPCNPSPCGPNTECRTHNNAGSCVCLPNYFGNPYEGCRPECVLNSDCPSSKACIQTRCQDPCPGTCGHNAICHVTNHLAICTCYPGYSGDPYSICHQKKQSKALKKNFENINSNQLIIEKSLEEPVAYKNPCQPSPCGPNSKCREINEQAVCSCVPDFVGLPPACRPECTTNSECPLEKACINRKCNDPCPGTCGHNAECRVLNHIPLCSCLLSYTGDPFSRCYSQPPSPPTPTSHPTAVIVAQKEKEPINPCYPSPCGQYAQCHNRNGAAICSCLPNYIGSPPNCRPECVINSDCPLHLSCINEKCLDPCPGSCGFSALCNVVNHIPNCVCEVDTTGDPFTGCYPQSVIKNSPPAVINVDPCIPSPCGVNAKCDMGSCACLPEYHGDPYVGCRPECVLNSDCSRDRACINQKCQDPCPGTCGISADCNVINHIPMCSCPIGMTGNAFIRCEAIREPIREDTPKPPAHNPCQPSPCGPNSQCRLINQQTVCSCITGFLGSPPFCHPECTTNSDCQADRYCLNQQCKDACAGACGIAAVCHAYNHAPMCSCPPRYTGNPFVRCTPIGTKYKRNRFSNFSLNY